MENSKTKLGTLHPALSPNSLVPRPRLEEYAEKYKDVFIMERRDGILEMRLHSDGGPASMQKSGSFPVWHQVWLEVGNDPENEVVIITATGDVWWDDTPHSDREPAPGWWEFPELTRHVYFTALKNTENLIFGINVPTISAISGPASVHCEFALACDIALCAEGAVFRDPHCAWGIAPGDGLGMTFQELLGTRRSAYYLYTSDAIDAKAALEFGLVNEVLPLEKLLPRAWEIAERIKTMPPLSRLMAKQIVRRRWQRRWTEDAAFHLSHELLGFGDVRSGDAFRPEMFQGAEERWQAALARRSDNA